MELVELQWLHDEVSLKEALQASLHCSGQLLKKHFSSKELQRPQSAKKSIKLPLSLVNHLLLNPSYEGSPGKILQETNDYLAIHKPPAIHSHPLSYEDKDTVLNWLVQEKKWEALKVNEKSYDRGLLFRLDYETSGVLLLAKNQEFFEKMRSGFHSEIKRKLYWVIVDGSFDQEGEWIHYFRATGAKGAKQKVGLDPHPEADLGSLEVRKLMESEGKSLLLVNLKSGLRHQIRAQLSALGFPILGDELYGGIKASRLFLHAWRYEWQEAIEDKGAELFGSFFDLDRATQMSHDMIGTFQR